MHACRAGSTSLSGEVRQAMGENLIALVLGGGYGRGEGGVLRVSGEERPYNDLDLVLIVRRKSGLPWETLHAIQHKYAALTGIEVDFSRPLTVDDVRAWPHTLMWSDLLQGHRVLDGPADILTAQCSRSAIGPAAGGGGYAIAAESRRGPAVGAARRSWMRGGAGRGFHPAQLL